MHIEIGRSTSAFMIADPLAILEEGEIHLGFSNMFEVPQPGRSDIMLHNIDILVARSPALLPSDVQKVSQPLRLSLHWTFLLTPWCQGSCRFQDRARNVQGCHRFLVERGTLSS